MRLVFCLILAIALTGCSSVKNDNTISVYAKGFPLGPLGNLLEVGFSIGNHQYIIIDSASEMKANSETKQKIRIVNIRKVSRVKKVRLIERSKP